MKIFPIRPGDPKPQATHVVTIQGNELLEFEARRLRDKVYGHKISDKEWANCREKWIADIEWLRANAD